MRIVDCEQGSSEWEILRMTRATASNFHRIITPKRGELSKSHRDYACELVAKQLSVYSEPPPSYWMEWGTENEPLAIEDYSVRTGFDVERVGFVMPDDDDGYGGSPDALVNDRTGVLETKCPKPETLIRYHADGVLPDEYRPQVQGLLLITGCQWCDFYAWHPELQPFKVTVYPDEAYQESMREALSAFAVTLHEITQKVSRSGVHIVKWGE